MDNNMIKIPLKDRSFSHCIFSNNPLPPTSFAKHIEWDRDTLNNNTVYTDLCINEAPEGTTVWLIEPRELISGIYEFVEKNAAKYKNIWTHDRDILNKFNNAVFVPLGGCWIKEEDRKIYEKTKNYSIITSSKQYLPGHKLRHELIKAAEGHIDVYGNGYTYIPYKLDGLKDYRYHFAIENTKKDFWFTEKLIDCLQTGTIPIYWGCPSIGKYFNTEGFIIFNDLSELKEKLKLCTPQYYESKKDAIKENFERSKKFILAEDWLYENDIYISQR